MQLKTSNGKQQHQTSTMTEILQQVKHKYLIISEPFYLLIRKSLVYTNIIP